jgi:hypothetical protein
LLQRHAGITGGRHLAPGATAITITVDVAANRHPINPNIYGVAHATTAELNDLNSPPGTAATTRRATTGN